MHKSTNNRGKPRRNLMAAALQLRCYRSRAIEVKTRYSRKPKHKGRLAPFSESRP